MSSHEYVQSQSSFESEIGGKQSKVTISGTMRLTFFQDLVSIEVFCQVHFLRITEGGGDNLSRSKYALLADKRSE